MSKVPNEHLFSSGYWGLWAFAQGLWALGTYTDNLRTFGRSRKAHNPVAIDDHVISIRGFDLGKSIGIISGIAGSFKKIFLLINISNFRCTATNF